MALRNSQILYIQVYSGDNLKPKNKEERNRDQHLKVLVFPWRRLAIALIVSIVCCLLAASIGSVSIDPITTLYITLSRLPLVDFTPTWLESLDTILWNIRFPRISLALLVGASLAVAGATYQGLFRNPLADPYFIGVASGAALGATLVFLSGIPFTIGKFSLLPVAAFIGGISAVSTAYLIASKSTGTSLPTLILAGVAIGSFATAVTSILMIRSEPDLRPLLSWIMGGFIRARWSDSLFMLPYFTIGIVLILIYSRILNSLQLDEEYATSIGVNVEKTKRILIIVSTVITAAAVSFSGLIGFVGLVAPHIVRLLWGTDYRTLIPMSAVIGGGFLVISDLIARTVVSPGELPVGIITAIFGAPFFIYLLVRKRSEIS